MTARPAPARAGASGGGASGSGGRRRRATTPSAQLFDLDLLRVERALDSRSRYKYVKPRVEAEGAGWKIVSPNCSRNIDAAGGEIDIAWFLPTGGGRWRLHARDHAQGRWVAKASGLTLTQALAIVCEDSAREYWQ